MAFYYVYIWYFNVIYFISNSILRACWLLLCMHSWLQLGKHKEALDYAMQANILDPTNHQLAEKVQYLREKLAAGWEKFVHMYSFYLKIKKINMNTQRKI
jgi:hypothetical protein